MTAAPQSPADDLLTILPLPLTLEVRGEDVSLSKLRLRQLPAALIVAAPLLPHLSRIPREDFTAETLMALLEKHIGERPVRDALVQLLALCTDHDTKFFERLKRSELAAAGVALLAHNAAVFAAREQPKSATQGKVEATPPTGCGLADVIQLLIRNGHRRDEVLDYDLDQLQAYQVAAIRAEKRARADFIEGVVLAASVIFSEKPGKALKDLTKDLRNG